MTRTAARYSNNAIHLMYLATELAARHPAGPAFAVEPVHLVAATAIANTGLKLLLTRNGWGPEAARSGLIAATHPDVYGGGDVPGDRLSAVPLSEPVERLLDRLEGSKAGMIWPGQILEAMLEDDSFSGLFPDGLAQALAGPSIGDVI